jgi:hypothetical protein
MSENTKQRQLVRGAFLCSLLILICAVLSGCGGSKNVKRSMVPVYGFYELCFYFPRTPEGTTDKDVEEASAIYVDHLESRGVTVFKKRYYSRSACFFTDTIPDFSKPVKLSQNNISQYILNAYFDKENASLFGIENVSGKYDPIFAGSSQRSVLPIYLPVEEGIFLRGTSSEIVFLARYLEILEIEHQFGMDEEGRLIINLGHDEANRWMMVPFLYESIDLTKFVNPKPGDYSILSECKDEDTEIVIFIPPWEKTGVPFAKDQSVGKEDSLLFSNSIVSLPFSEDVLPRYIYSLAGSHLLPPSSGLFYSPNFSGGIVVPQVYLLTSEIAIDGVSTLSSEKILLWLLSVNSELEEYPDTLYANILSLKLAKRLYTGTPQFLGGSEMFNPTAAIPFESVRRYLFNKGNVSVFGAIDNSLYLNSDEIILEYPSFTEIEKVKGFKAFFGAPDNSCRSIVSIVFRSKKAFELVNSVKNQLSNAGYTVIQTLFEQISENDSWGSVSISITAEKEKYLSDFFEKKIKKMDKSMSLGVYRVQE